MGRIYRTKAALLILFFLPFFPLALTFGQSSTSTMKPYWEYSYNVKQVTLNDSIKIAYVEQGEHKNTLLMIHGLGSYLAAYNKLIDELSTDFRCIAIDLPGYGKSSVGDFSYSMDFFAETLLQFIDKLQLENVHLIGHSMGGQIAITTVLKDQADIKKLILLAPAGFETFSETDRQWFSQVVTPQVLKITPDVQIEKNFAVNFNGAVLPEDARFMYEDRLKLKENVTDYEAYCQMIPRCVQGMLEAPVFDQLSEIKQSTLIFYGKNDLLIPNKFLHPESSTEQVARAGDKEIPNSELVLLEECGHFVLWDQAEKVSQQIRNFIQQ